MTPRKKQIPTPTTINEQNNSNATLPAPTTVMETVKHVLTENEKREIIDRLVDLLARKALWLMFGSILVTVTAISALFGGFISREREINDLRSKNAALETNIKICEDKLKYQNIHSNTVLTKKADLLRKILSN